MEHFIVSARKYRPQKFEDLIGQQAIKNTLENAIKNNHLAQAMLFTGPRGVGKTSCARIVAKTINQETSDRHREDFAFNIFELDAASNNSVDDIRNLAEQVRIPPQTGKYKVYIIDEVHMLSSAAFNAFLKTLEEPPSHAIFILATTEKHKIIPTILSRCQIFDFKRITVLDAKNYLKLIAKKENVTAHDEALHMIAKKADGAMRDALSIFDRIVSFSGNNLTLQAVSENLNILDYDTYFEITDMLLENKIPRVLGLFNDVLSRGFEGHDFINGLASHFRDLLVSKDESTINLLEVGDSTKKKYLDQSIKATPHFLIHSIEKANQCDLNYRVSKNQRLLVELALIQMASLTFNEEKKKPSDYIIPASFFSSLPQIKQSEEKVTQRTEEDPKNSYEKSEGSVPPILKSSAPKRTIRRSSSLSLKSIHHKKEVEKLNAQTKHKNSKEDVFTQEELQKVWRKYQEILVKNGEKSMASILGINLPILKEGFETSFTLPNKLMRDQLKRIEPKIIKFLKESLNNNSVKLQLIVDERQERLLTYTPLEKYNHLKKKNVFLEKLNDSFKLDL